MLVKKLQLKNFKNYKQESIELTSGLNVLYGKNAQGKTNAVEAVFYLCTGTSLRSRRDKLLINHGEDNALISGDFSNRFGNIKLEAKIFEHSRELYVNGEKLSRSRELLGNINCVFFSPAELRLIQDGPDERRRFLNISISQTDRLYYSALVKYNKILEQRNSLLKEKDIGMILDTLPVWDEQFSSVGAEIIFARQRYMQKVSVFAKKNHYALTKNHESLEISLEKNYNGEKEEIKNTLFGELKRAYDKDIRLGYTTVGPHRDDIDVILDGVDAKNYCSQGQTRTIALALKLAEVDYFYMINNEYPILILDDVLSELDLDRRKKLFKKIENMQTLLTCSHKVRSFSYMDCNKLEIENGRVKRV